MSEGSEPEQRQATSTRGGGGRFTRTPEGAERDATAARLRGQGLSYRAIADRLNIDVRAAHDAVQRALREIVEEPAEDVRRIELERLDTMYEAAMGVLKRQHVTVSNGRVVCLDDEPLPDDGPVLHAIDRLLRISERRAKLLGLDSAQKVDVSGGVRYEVVGVDPADLK